MNNPTYFALLEACQQPGCPVCRVVQGAVQLSLDHLFYESVTDPAVRTRLRRSLGFCREHAWLLLDARIGDALGMAIIYEDILANLVKHLPSGQAPPTAKPGLGRTLRSAPLGIKALAEKVLHGLTPHQHCPACTEQTAVTRMATQVLVESLRKPEFVSALNLSSGLCLPHLRGAVGAVPDPDSLTTLLSLSREKLENLRLELAELIRKNDYRYRDEPIGAEGDSWRRAVAMAVGADPSRGD